MSLDTATKLKIAFLRECEERRRNEEKSIEYDRAYWVKVRSFDMNAEKPLRVGRIHKNQEVETNCYVTERIRELYQAGKLAVGDFVLIQFVDGDPDKPIAVEKAYKSW